MPVRPPELHLAQAMHLTRASHLASVRSGTPLAVPSSLPTATPEQAANERRVSHATPESRRHLQLAGVDASSRLLHGLPSQAPAQSALTFRPQLGPSLLQNSPLGSTED
ncbi:hypothetical protein NDU88_003288 [Pleurodeles waltl]|uniref:Uncharacterized protein n=1 Tax=Pleurodeles waltl TaxID=8319 RepID=A0AAV7L3J2_PLEWA|nr:hypothetical protein NDU88_003288 [Pleurodeles waltl]